MSFKIDPKSLNLFPFTICPFFKWASQFQVNMIYFSLTVLKNTDEKVCGFEFLIFYESF